MKRFGVMLDVSRNAVMKPCKVKEFAKILRSFGYNSLQLYMEDVYEIKDEPYFGYFRGRYSKEELKDVVDYCDSIGIEVTPCIQTLAHLSTLFRNEKFKSIQDAGDVLLVDEQKTYELIEKMFASLREYFKSNYINIGMDEAILLGSGNYFNKHGFKEKIDIFCKHLSKVVKIAKKYNFEPHIWSDMLFRVANNGEYYSDEPFISDKIKNMIPDDVGLVYWDYYHIDKEFYCKMIDAHLSTNREVTFVGGARSWYGFASGNHKSLETMFPAMDAAKEKNIKNIFIAMWGDDGKECSFFSLLPSLFAIKMFYDGQKDLATIKKEFHQITGEIFDNMMALDLPNFISNNQDCRNNICKYMLYSDVFNGFLDSTIQEEASYDFSRYAKLLRKYSLNSQYKYIFLHLSNLCNIFSLKYDLGVRTRKLYQKRDFDGIKYIVKDYKKLILRLEKFHLGFESLWMQENKPHGFEIHDIRIGGLIQRLKSCSKRLISFINGDVEIIEELEEKLLDYYGNEDEFIKKPTWFNNYKENVSMNIL